MDIEEIINTRPDKKDLGSCAPWKLRHLYKICMELKPKLIVESGTWKGNSLWLFRKACPNAIIHSHDIDYSNLKWKDKSIIYHEYDIAYLSDYYNPCKNDLIFFDDHQCQEGTLIWADHIGFKHIIFDDNIPSNKLKNFKAPPIPTLEMMRENGNLPEFIDKYEILEYDNSDTKAINNGQTYLTYVRLK